MRGYGGGGGGKGSFRRNDQEGGGEKKPRGLSFLKSFEQQQQIPSSPPPWPQMSVPAPVSAPAPPFGMPAKGPISRYGTVNTKLSALDEEEEESQASGMREAIEDEGSVIQNQAPKPTLHQSKNTRVTSNGSVVHNNTDTLASRKVSFGSVRLEPTSRKPSDANTARSASWNLTQGSDDFSPVFISKHNTADGRIAYAALDLSKSELEAKLARLRESQTSQQRQRSGSQSTKYTGDESSFARLESEALPEDLPVGTPDVNETTVANIGEFVSIKRGGYSEIGSFKRRPLSPSPLRRPLSASGAEDSSMSMLPRLHAELDYSGVPPAVPTPPAASAPKTPSTERVGNLLSPQRAKSGNSPLKLFENHDTFTANRLQRRISQLEEPESDSIGGETRQSPSRRATGDLSAVDEASFVSRASPQVQAERYEGRQSSIQHHFGNGDFDDYAFEEQAYSSPSNSHANSSLNHDEDRDVPSRSVSPDILPPGYQQPFRFHVEGPPSDFVDTFKSRRKPSRDSANRPACFW